MLRLGKGSHRLIYRFRTCVLFTCPCIRQQGQVKAKERERARARTRERDGERSTLAQIKRHLTVFLLEKSLCFNLQGFQAHNTDTPSLSRSAHLRFRDSKAQRIAGTNNSTHQRKGQVDGLFGHELNIFGSEKDRNCAQFLLWMPQGNSIMLHPHFFLSHYLFRMPVLIVLFCSSCGLRVVLLLLCLLIASMLARSNSKRRREGRGRQFFVSCCLGCCCEPQRMVDETLLLDGVSNDKVVVYCYYLHIESRAVSDSSVNVALEQCHNVFMT